MMCITEMTVSALKMALEQRELSARETAAAYLSRIRKQEPAIGA